MDETKKHSLHLRKEKTMKKMHLILAGMLVSLTGCDPARYHL